MDGSRLSRLRVVKPELGLTCRGQVRLIDISDQETQHREDQQCEIEFHQEFTFYRGWAVRIENSEDGRDFPHTRRRFRETVPYEPVPLPFGY